MIGAIIAYYLGRQDGRAENDDRPPVQRTTREAAIGRMVAIFIAFCILVAALAGVFGHSP